MRLVLASEPVPGAVNEDFAAVTATTVVVLDGAAMPAGLDTGCIHGIPWYVHHLAYALLDQTERHDTLTQALSQAITDVATQHQDSCQPGHSCSPSATVALARIADGQVDWLVLGDAFLVVDGAEGIRVISDDRLARVGANTRTKVRQAEVGTPEHQRRFAQHVQAIRETRNRPGGYWVAASEPEVADEALTGSMPTTDVHRLALMSDGAARPVDRFGLLDWPTCLDLLDHHGPEAFIRQVRQAETDDAGCTRWPRSKRHDDATAILCRP